MNKQLCIFCSTTTNNIITYSIAGELRKGYYCNTCRYYILHLITIDPLMELINETGEQQ